jgi:Protein of unknown function (DUF3386)
MSTPNNARELFQTAYTSRYTWDEEFPGYSADVELVQAQTAYVGKIRIAPNLTIEVTGIADEQVQGGILTQLTDLVILCKRTAFEELGVTDVTEITHEENVFEVLVKGVTDSKYKIRGREIIQIDRRIGNTSVVFEYHENFDTGEGYIPSRYNAIFCHAQTNQIITHLQFTDSYTKIGRYYMMTKQVIQEYEGRDGDISSSNSTTEFKYSNIKLNEPARVY